MNYMSTVFTLLLATSVACSSDKDSGADQATDGSDGTTDGGSGTDDGFAPQEGQWQGGEDELTENSCGDLDMDEEEAEASDPITISATANGFQMTNDDATFNCTLNGQNFTCNEEVSDTDLAEMGGGTLTVSFLFSGQFSSDAAGVVDFESDVTCEGAGCDAMAIFGFTFPCAVKGSFPIDLME